jgi:cytochrome c-type biogenesis protein CcmH
MLFWIIVAVLAVFVAGSLALPLWRPGDKAAESAPDQAIYRDQLAEVDRDLARGVLDGEEAARARAEIARRLLAADRAGPAARAEAPASLSRVLGGVLALAVAAGSVALYWTIGQPGYPDMPLAARLAESEAQFRNRLPQAQAEAMAADLVAQARVTPPEDIAATVAEVRATLDTAPDDLATLTLLRDFEAGTRNWPEAARLQDRILAVKDDQATTDDLILLIDLRVFAANGYVAAETMALLDQLALATPDSPALPFFQGLVYRDIGRPDLAFEEWRPLAEAGDGAGIFATRARAMVEDAAFDAGLEYTLPPERGPSAGDVAAAEQMSDEDRAAMIGNMVAGLAERLATEGGPAADWAQLITAYGVLGQTEAAAAIWAEAQGVFADDAAGMAALLAAAQGAGVAE